MLCTDTIDESTQLIMNKFPELDIQLSILSPSPESLRRGHNEIIYIHHANNHFITSTNKGGRLAVYDSLNINTKSSTNSLILAQLAQIYTDDNKIDNPIILNRHHPHMIHSQKGSYDCGLFALAYAVDIAFNSDPGQVS